MNIKTYYIYRHLRNDTKECFYIGLGHTKIIYDNPKKTYERAYNNYRKYNCWKEIDKISGHIVEITHTNLSKEEAIKIEIDLIAFYGRKDLKLGSLVNQTDGGEGCVAVNYDRKAVIQLDVEGNFIKEWESNYALRFTYPSFELINSCCKKLSNSAYGYQWVFKENYDPSVKTKIKVITKWTTDKLKVMQKFLNKSDKIGCMKFFKITRTNLNETIRNYNLKTTKRIKNIEIEKTCPICDKVFFHKRKKVIYCSINCSNKNGHNKKVRHIDIIVE